VDHRAGQRGRPPFLISEDFADDLEIVTEALAGRLVPTDDGPGLPQEWHDYQLAQHMGWTSQELESCPVYRRALWTHFLYAERNAQAEQSEAADPQARQQHASSARSEIARARAAVDYQEDS